MAKEILYKNTESGKLETIDSSELVGGSNNFVFPSVSAEIFYAGADDWEARQSPDDPTKLRYIKTSTDNARYYNPYLNIEGLKLGIRFHNLPEIDGEIIKTIHLELGRYKKARTKKVTAPRIKEDNSDFTPAELEASGKDGLYKQRRAGFKWHNDFREEGNYEFGLDFENRKSVDIGNLKDIRPRIFPITEVNSFPYFFNFGAEYYFYPNWAEKLLMLKEIEPTATFEIHGVTTDLDEVGRLYSSYPHYMGDGLHRYKWNDVTNLGIGTFKRFKAITASNDIDNNSPEITYYNGYIQGVRRRTRILFAVRLRYNKGLPNEYTTPILMKFNLVGAMYPQQYDRDFKGQINIYPSNI